MKRWIPRAAFLSLLIASHAFAQTGMISGAVTPVSKCRAIRAVDRAKVIKSFTAIDKKAKAGFPAKLDSATGKYVIDGLPEGKYDVIVETSVGAIAGVDLSLTETDKSDAPLTDKDKEALTTLINKYPDHFMNKRRVLHIDGNGKHANVLMELIRDREFHSDKGGEVIWRIESWIFDKLTGVWQQRQTAGKKVIERERMKAEQFTNLPWTFDLSLGGKVIKGGTHIEGVDLKIPDQLDPDKTTMPFAK